jgi:hypothetical protein
MTGQSQEVKILIAAVGEVLKDERERFAAILDARLAALDGSNLLKTAAGALLKANLGAIDRFLTDIEIRKAAPVREASALPEVVKVALKGGAS